MVFCYDRPRRGKAESANPKFLLNTSEWLLISNYLVDRQESSLKQVSCPLLNSARAGWDLLGAQTHALLSGDHF